MTNARYIEIATTVNGKTDSRFITAYDQKSIQRIVKQAKKDHDAIINKLSIWDSNMPKLSVSISYKPNDSL